MAVTSTQRCREHRARKRAGVERFELELPLAALGETLVAAGWLGVEDRDDYDCVHAALARALIEWVGIEPA
jgi:hypothetical protein